MKKSKKDSHAVAVRLTSEERADVAALAAIEGKAVSAFIRDLLRGAITRPRPTLAASGALLGIGDALFELADKLEIEQGTRDLISEQMRLVISIVRLHEREYTA